MQRNYNVIGAGDDVNPLGPGTDGSVLSTYVPAWTPKNPGLVLGDPPKNNALLWGGLILLAAIALSSK